MSENRPKTGFSPYSSDQTNHSHTENGILLCKLFFEREREAIRKTQNTDAETHMDWEKSQNNRTQMQKHRWIGKNNRTQTWKQQANRRRHQCATISTGCYLVMHTIPHVIVAKMGEDQRRNSLAAEGLQGNLLVRIKN